MNSRRLRPISGPLLWLLLLGTCCTVLPMRGGAAQESAAQSAPKRYLLGPGDELTIIVTPQKTYNATVTVDEDGFIKAAGIGKIRATGKTVDDLEKQIQELLNRDLVDPEVLVTVSKRRAVPEVKVTPPGKVTIVGAVAGARELEIEPDGLRVRKALDRAGGTSKDADLKAITIFHKNLTRTIVDLSTDDQVRNPAHNILLVDGDSVEVKAIPMAPEKDKPMVEIRGAVVTPQRMEFKSQMTLEDLIILGGKLTFVADTEKVELRRMGESLRVVNLEAQYKMGYAGRVLLEPGDAVFVPEHKNRILMIGGNPNPGPRALKPGQKLYQMLRETEPGVLNPAIIDLEKVEVVRNGAMEPIRVNLLEVLRSKRKKEFVDVELQNGDIVFLPPKVQKNSRGLSDYFGAASSLGFLFSFL